jgi:hypothetical protein
LLIANELRHEQEKSCSTAVAELCDTCAAIELPVGASAGSIAAISVISFVLLAIRR